MVRHVDRIKKDKKKTEHGTRTQAKSEPVPEPQLASYPDPDPEFVLRGIRMRFVSFRLVPLPRWNQLKIL